jgi:hypothetical protein
VDPGGIVAAHSENSRHEIMGLLDSGQLNAKNIGINIPNMDK